MSLLESSIAFIMFALITDINKNKLPRNKLRIKRRSVELCYWQ